MGVDRPKVLDTSTGRTGMATRGPGITPRPVQLESFTLATQEDPTAMSKVGSSKIPVPATHRIRRHKALRITQRSVLRSLRQPQRQ